MSDLSDIFEAFAMPVTYTGGALNAAEISAVKSDVEGETFQGPGRSARHIWFELQKSDVPGKPKKGHVIVEVEGGATWRVIDSIDRSDIAAWEASVEAA